MQGFKEVHEEYDFIVVGGGLTGLCAAIAAARHGARTALVQDRPVLGGNASSEIRMHVCGASQQQKKPWLNEGGILHELMLDNKRVNDYFVFSLWDAVLFEAARREKNLKLYLNAPMSAAHAENGRVQEIECYQMTTEKRLLLRAKVFADCTGNGTLGAFVGAPFRTGSEGKAEFNEPDAPEKANNRRMGNTLLFKAMDMGHPVKFTPPTEIMHLSEEDLHLRKHGPEKDKDVLNIVDENGRKMLFDGYCPDFGYWWIELTGEDADIISEYEDIRDDLVKAVYGVWDHIKNTDHNAETYALQWVGMLPGVRESRRMEGDYMLNENDVLGNHHYDDAVAYGGWQIDNHAARGMLDFDKLPSDNIEFAGSYDIPYRCYLAKGFENLYISGRSMSASKLAMASSRVMGTCAIGGQAVGTAAAMAVQAGGDIRAIDIQALRQMLLRDDCYLPGVRNEDEKDLARTAQVTASSEKEGYAAVNVINGVSRNEENTVNEWISNGDAKDEWLMLQLAEPKEISMVQLTFDSNFNIEKKIALSSRRQKQQVIGVPPELVRDFTVELLQGGKTVFSKKIEGNWQRLCRVETDKVLCDAVRVRFEATNGCSEARVFEVRLYE